MKTTLFVVVALLLSVPAFALDFGNSPELYLPNQAGGDIVLTKEPCVFPSAVKIGFTNRSYATEESGPVHEGCWMAPEIEPAALEQAPTGATIISIINLWYDNRVNIFTPDQFTPYNHSYTKKEQ